MPPPPGSPEEQRNGEMGVCRTLVEALLFGNGWMTDDGTSHLGKTGIQTIEIEMLGLFVRIGTCFMSCRIIFLCFIIWQLLPCDVQHS